MSAQQRDPNAITVQTALRDAATIVDVRSPAEYAKGHVAGAINLPLFSDGERAEIGTLYKLLGRERAIATGLEFLGARLSAFVQSFEPHRGGAIAVYCARGGMRSAAVAGLLSALGFRVTQLPGGYKAFRNHLLSVFEQGLPPRLIVLHGRTGVGKTEILNRLDNSLDLEDCAQHRSSLFGAINLQPRTQQQFDAQLLAVLDRLKYATPVWIEGESRKIGKVTMPEALRKAMQRATCVLVTASLESRVDRIVAEYGRADQATRAQCEGALRGLTIPLGKKRVKEMIARVRADDYRPVVEALLLDYYDPRYEHSMRNNRYALTISSDDPGQAVHALRALARGLSTPQARRDGRREGLAG